MVYKLAGIRLLRDASQQVTQGRTVDFLEQCESGDLAFFDTGKGHIGHVGIILPDCHVIHASGKVRIDKLDHFGIFNKEQNKYTHQLRIVKRMLADPILPNAPESSLDQENALANQTALFG
jgi:cell wall-associated NlpC family hydrolase